MADQDIWLGGHIVLRIQTFGQEGANLICLSVSHVYFCVGGGAEVYSQTGWGPWPVLPSHTGLPLSRNRLNYMSLLCARGKKTLSAAHEASVKLHILQLNCIT